MVNLKDDWKIKTLGEVCDLMTGGTPSRNHPEYFNGGEIKWLVSGDIHKKEIFDCEGRITQSGFDNSNAKFLPIDSVLIALNGQGKTRGTVALLRTNATCNQSLVSINPKDKNLLSSEYLFRVLDGRYDEIRRMTGDTGNERRGLNMPLIRSIKIPIPPLQEQKRLVKILDEKFGAIEELKRVTEQQIADAKELFESRLGHVFESLKSACGASSLDICVEFKGGGTPSKRRADFWNGDIPWVSPKDMKVDVIHDSEDHITSTAVKSSTTNLIPKDSILIVVRSGILSRIIPIAINAREVTLNQDMKALIPKSGINSKYLFYALKASTPHLLSKVNKGATVHRLQSDFLFELPIAVCSESVQKETVKELDELSEKTKELEAIFRRKIADLDELKKSYLEQAFSGKL